MTDREDLRERLDAVEEQLPDRRAREPPESHKEAVRAGLAYYYDHYDAVGAESDDIAVSLSKVVEHVDEPHATTLREILGREENT
jgi:hypothetical protein